MYIILKKSFCKYIFILFYLFISCSNESNRVDSIDFEINGKMLPSIISGTIDTSDADFYLAVLPNEKVKCSASISDENLIWKLNNVEISVGPNFEKLFTDTGLYAISLHYPHSELVTTKYVYIKADELVKDSKGDTAVFVKKLDKVKPVNCNRIVFHVTEGEGVLYDIPKGNYMIKVHEGKSVNSYYISADGKNEVTWNWKKKHFPKPSDLILDLYIGTKLECTIKQSN